LPLDVDIGDLLWTTWSVRNPTSGAWGVDYAFPLNPGSDARTGVIRFKARM
jgi:hypothetical protein